MRIVIYIYEGLTLLDAIGPYEILKTIKGVSIQFVAKQKGLIMADSQFVSLEANYGIDEIHSADLLVIPGATISFIKEMKDKAVLNWIRKIDQTTQKTVSVCTGSLILAATGLLQGKQATSHWKTINLLKRYGVNPLRQRKVEAGKYVTAAGVSAGIDMALFLVDELAGATAAKAAQLLVEYDPKPMYESGNYLKAEKKVIDLSEKILKFDARKNLTQWEVIKFMKTLLKLK